MTLLNTKDKHNRLFGLPGELVIRKVIAGRNKNTWRTDEPLVDRSFRRSKYLQIINVRFIEIFYYRLAALLNAYSI